MAENILINFDANVQELTKTIDLLEKMGLVAKKDADAFKAMNATTNQTVQNQNAVQKELTETEKALQGVTKEATKASTTVENAGKKSGFKSAASDIGGLESGLKKIGGMIAGAFAIERVIAFGAESVKAFQEAEKNALILRSAVSVNGGLQADFDDLIRQSEELQKITIFSDDAVQKAQTAALQFGLTKDQVKALIPVVADFASATGQDLQSALDGVLQGVNGMGRGLKIYGVGIDETQSKTERLEDITGQLTKKFEYQAEAVGNTASGAAAKYANEIDNLQESLGSRLAPVLNQVRGVLLETTEALLETVGLIDNPLDVFEVKFQKFKNTFKEKLATQSVEDLQKKYLELIEVQKKVTGESLTTVLAQKAAILELLNAANATEKVLTEQEKAVAKLGDIANLTDKELNELIKTFAKFNSIDADDATDKITKELEARAKARQKAVAEEKKLLKEQATDIEKFKKELSDKEFAADEENLKLFIAKEKEALVAQNLNEADLEEQLTRLELKELEMRLKNYQDYGKDIGNISEQIADKKLQIQKDTNKKIQASDDALYDAYLQSLKDKEDADKKAADEKLAREKEIANAIVDLAKGTINAIADVTNAYYEQRIDQIDRDKERILESYDEQLEANEDLHSKNKKGDRQYENDKKKLEAERKKAEEKADKEKRKLMREQAEFNKAMALTQAVINAALGVTSALTIPPPAGYVLAALTAALAAVEIAAIIAAPIPGYAKGKERIEGRGTETSDDVPARLSVGERVVRASTNRKYFPILSAIHHERFDPETMNSLSRFSPETLRKLATVDQSLIHDLATMQPVFMKHVSNVPDVRFRNDITPRMQSAHLLQMVNYNVAAGMNEYDMSRALKKGTKVDNVKEIAKEVGKEIIENMGENIRRKI